METISPAIRSRIILIAFGLVGLLLFVACSITSQVASPQEITPTDSSYPYEIIGQGSPPQGISEDPDFRVIRGDSDSGTDLEGFTPEITEILKRELEAKEIAMYVVISGGAQPSSGYSLKVISLTVDQKDNVKSVNIDYSLERPDPESGGATVITYPFVIIKIPNILIPPDQVNVSHKNSGNEK